jgi:hypothetical protein
MEPQEDDYVITDARSGGYMLFTSGHYSDKSLGKYRTRDAAFASARRRMEKEGFYSDVYYMNERGTVDLLDADGNFSKENPADLLDYGLVAVGVGFIGLAGYLVYKAVTGSNPLAPSGPVANTGNAASLTPQQQADAQDAVPPFVSGT